MFLVLLLVLFATTLDKIVFLPNKVYTKGNSLPQKTSPTVFVLTEYTENMVNIAKSLESLKDFLVLMAQDDF